AGTAAIVHGSVEAAIVRAAAGCGLSVAVRPLVLGGRNLGVLATFLAVGVARVAEAGRVLDAFAAQTVIAIDHARLADEEQRARAAAESDRLKSVFLASLSHDLRTPLTAIKAAAAVLASGTSGPASLEAAVGIDLEVDRLNRL